MFIAVPHSGMTGRFDVHVKNFVLHHRHVLSGSSHRSGADKPAAPAGRSPVLKTNSVKAAKMNARGKVVEISETAVKIERIIKGNAEIVEFALEYPARAVAVNDFVKIDYTVQEGKLTAVRVAKLGAPKATGKSTVKPAAEKPTVVTQ
jgi:hypothetical protein